LQSATSASSPPVKSAASVGKRGKFLSEGLHETPAEIKVRVQTPEVVIGSAGEAVGLGSQVR
jgi:hypothetical protein